MRRQAVLGEVVKVRALLLAVIFLLSGCQAPLNCQDPLGCVIIPAGKPLLMGVEKATTGDEQIVFQAVIEALQQARTVNPMVDNHQVEFYLQDAACNPQERLKTASALPSISDLAIIFGPICQAESKSYAKMVSDAGLTLISPGPVNDLSLEPGWFTFYPSLDALTAAFDQAIPTENNPDFLIAQDQATDQAFGTKFCELRIKKGRDCKVILNLEPGDDDLSQLSTIYMLEPGTLYVIMPFSDASRLTGLPESYQNMNLVFFDPELGKLVDLPRLNSKNESVITYSLRNNAKNLLVNISPDTSEITAGIAIDSYNLVMQNLAKVVRVGSDGSLIIPRQGLRNAMINTNSFEGLAGEYGCNNQNVCLDPAQFLTRFTPKQ